MIALDVEQNTQAWFEARMGVATASCFNRIVTPGGKLSAQREGYIGELLAEYFTGMPVVEFGGNDATEWGKAHEPDAFKYFAFQTEMDVRNVGFVYEGPQRTIGASPDGMVGDNVPLELKCPMNAGIHLTYLFRGVVPPKYVPQTQGQIYVCDSDHGYFMSYAPGLPPLVVRVEPDFAYQAALNTHLPAFIDEMLAARDKLISMGVTPAGGTA